MLSLNLKSMLEKVNYFSEIYNPGQYDDNDFVLKQWACGYNPHSVKEAWAFHVPHPNKYLTYCVTHEKMFYERWQLERWNWHKMPSHSLFEKCKCSISKIIMDVARTNMEHLKERWASFEEK
jgi:hypothetical protein